MRALLIEADAGLARFVSWALQEHQIDVATNEASAVRLLGQQRYELAIIGSGEIDALKLLPLVRRAARIPVLLLGTKLDEQKKMLFGVRATLLPPYDVFDLRDAFSSPRPRALARTPGSFNGAACELVDLSSERVLARGVVASAGERVMLGATFPNAAITLQGVVKEAHGDAYPPEQRGCLVALQPSTGWAEVLYWPSLPLSAIQEAEFQATPQQQPDEMHVELKGSGDMRVSQRLQELLRAVHNATLRHRLATAVVDFRRLEFINSSCLKAFVVWLEAVHALPREKRYRVRFEVDRAQGWQSRALQPVAPFAGDALVILPR